MRINANKFKALVDGYEGGAAALAQSIRTNDGDKAAAIAEKKVRNWASGRAHPRPKASEMRSLASALGVRPSAFCVWTSQYRFARSSERKSDLMVELIRGRGVQEALALLEVSPRRASVLVNKALMAAVADAEQADADVRRLVVSEARADKAVIIKRFQPKDRGRAHPIQKRTSHITISVEEAS